LIFEGHRGAVTEGAVAPPWVVERLDIIEDGKLSVAPGGENDLVQAGIAFEGTPERLHRSIVVAIPRPAHAALQPGGRQQRDVVGVDILAATVGMMQDPFGRLASLEGVPEGGQGQAGVQRRRAGPADDASAGPARRRCTPAWPWPPSGTPSSDANRPKGSCIIPTVAASMSTPTTSRCWRPPGWSAA